MGDMIIEVKNLSKEYKLGMVVENANFQIKKKGIYGLVGPNGAGKTTIMKMLGGLVLPTEGEITMYGGSSEKELQAARKRMSFMIEIPYVKKDYNARTNLERTRILKGISDKGCIDRTLELVGLADVSNQKPVKKFSLGMQQRLGIANALLQEPEVLILDEPVNGLDPEGIVEIRNLLLRLNQEREITILISSHILSELEHLCTDYIFINKGKITECISNQELHEACRKALLLHTSDDDRAEEVLREFDASLEIVRAENRIRIPAAEERVYDISRTLYEHGVIPVHISEEGKDLEEYYLSLTAE
jgi:ABC-2 type transport system ATP-binding protein